MCHDARIRNAFPYISVRDSLAEVARSSHRTRHEEASGARGMSHRFSCSQDEKKMPTRRDGPDLEDVNALRSVSP